MLYNIIFITSIQNIKFVPVIEVKLNTFFNKTKIAYGYGSYMYYVTVVIHHNLWTSTD